ncbi:MAG: glycosyltransferase family 9 protein, partial [Bryobacteraceae bacterium]
RQLAAQMPLPVRFCAGPEEALEGAFRVDDLYALGCWLASARAYTGNDSGISHLVAAVGTPAVVLFGPTDPAVWAPRGPAVRVVHGNPISDISVPEVLLEFLTLAAEQE